MTAPLVLVHGGAHGSWCWEPTTPHLHGDVLAFDLPPKSIRGVPSVDPPPPELATTRLDDFAASAIADIDAAGFERFVLVGHSMGGLTIAEVARRIPERILHLVFVSCLVPRDGGRALDTLWATRDEVPIDVKEAVNDIGLQEVSIRSMFCNDMTEEQARFVLDHTGTEAGEVLGERVTRDGIPPGLPKTYVRLLRDQALPTDDQDRAIAALRDAPGGDVEVVELDTGHDVMISAPEQLASVLNRIAQVAAA